MTYPLLPIFLPSKIFPVVIITTPYFTLSYHISVPPQPYIINQEQSHLGFEKGLLYSKASWK